MDDDKIKETIEFILNNQAQFYADLQQIQETNREIQETNKQLQETNKEIQKQQQETNRQFLEFQKDSEQRLGILERATIALVDTTIQQGKNIAELTADIKELREAQKSADGRLNAVIFMAEKFFSGENGKKKK